MRSVIMEKALHSDALSDYGWYFTKQPSSKHLAATISWSETCFLKCILALYIVKVLYHGLIDLVG